MNYDMKDVDAIFTADWHIRETVPICRTDDFASAMWIKIAFVRQLQRKYQCPVIHAGDLLDHWKPSPYLLSCIIDDLPEHFYTVYGQHELPQHSLEFAERSGTFTLDRSGALIIMMECHFGETPVNGSIKIAKRNILVWHTLTWHKTLPYPNCVASNAEQLLDAYPQFDVIVTGDNHKPFVVKRNGRLLVNPGSLMRQTADQADHRPRVYLYNAHDNTVTKEFIPIEDNVISTDHIELAKQRDSRIEAFITSLSEEWDVDISFTENIERFFQQNEIRPSVKDIIRRALDAKARAGAG